MRASLRSLALLVALGVASGSQLADAQDAAGGFSLTAVVLNVTETENVPRLWFAIKNDNKNARILCTRSRGYALIGSGDSINQLRPYIEDNAQLHGCVRDGLLLPGETKFESLVLEAMPQGPYDLSVDVEIMERPVGSTAPFSTRRLSWKGRLSDAIALGAKLKAALLR